MTSSPNKTVTFFKVTRTLVLALVLYLCMSYIALPVVWRHYEYHPSLKSAPKTCFTRSGRPGDPLNIGLIGTEEQVSGAMAAAGFSRAMPASVINIAHEITSIVLKKQYRDAPVSGLYLFGRKQDMAFEKTTGKSSKQRHHVRFWRSDDYGKNGRPIWLGATTFDRSVGLGRRTGQITHHISPDIDAERDTLIDALNSAKQLEMIYQVTGIGLMLNGRNGEGDRYFTDGEMTVGIIAAGTAALSRPVRPMKNPVFIELKNRVSKILKGLLNRLSAA